MTPSQHAKVLEALERQAEWIQTVFAELCGMDIPADDDFMRASMSALTKADECGREALSIMRAVQVGDDAQQITSTAINQTIPAAVTSESAR
jgi:O-acetyl-ADP-ribose deacetylase (regulator of RNase III)